LTLEPLLLDLNLLGYQRPRPDESHLALRPQLGDLFRPDLRESELESERSPEGRNRRMPGAWRPWERGSRRCVGHVLARRIRPRTVYPFARRTAAREEPSCPVLPVIGAL
jgi:hypothetical protein